MACAAYGCNNRTPGNRAKKVPGLSFHRFPKDRIRRAEWIKAVRRADWTPTFCSTLCSEHFKESDFDKTPFRTFLKSNAVPSIFKGFPKWMQKKPSACVNPVPLSSSLTTKQDADGTLSPHIKNVRSTNKIVVDQNKPGATPTFSNYRKNDCDKNTEVIVTGTADYKNVLNDHSDANRRIVISDQLNLKNGTGSAFTHIENVGSTNDKVVVQNKPVYTPTFSNNGINEPDKNTIVIVSNTTDYKNVLDDHSDANRRIVISDQLILKNKSGSSLANTYQSSSGNAIPENNEKIGLDMYKEDPLLLFDDEFHIQRIKELEELIKSFYKQRKNWLQKIRRMKRRFKKLRKEYVRYNKKKNHSLLHCNSQPVVHFLALDVKNV